MTRRRLMLHNPRSLTTPKISVPRSTIFYAIKYLWEVLGDGLKNYSALAYIGMGFGDFGHYELGTEEEARERDWGFHKLEGSLDLLLRLMNGDWNEEDFLVVPPGKVLHPSHDAGVIRAE